MYAIVDIETSGGNHKTGKITEVAIYVHDGTKIIEEYSTLINPQTKIDWYVKKLTGITDEMVASAPTFKQVASKIDEITYGNIFIAHSVDFDYYFLREEFKKVGYNFKRKKLCTIELSRKILPGKGSYSLGKLCDELNIPISDRHRAAGDALATTKLFEMLLENDKKSLIPRQTGLDL